MDKRFPVFLALGLVAVGALLFFILSATEGNHLRLEGKILKVRVMMQPGSSSALVFVDFRASNPSDVRFVTGSAKMFLLPARGEEQEGTTVSKPEVDTIFQYQKLLGPKYNDVLSLQDRVAPHATLDRMMGASFELGEDAINQRKNLRVRLEDVDGAVADIRENPINAR